MKIKKVNELMSNDELKVRITGIIDDEYIDDIIYAIEELEDLINDSVRDDESIDEQKLKQIYKIISENFK